MLNDLNVRMACLANNHIMDRGLSGLTDTFSALDSNGIARVGAGANGESAAQPIYQKSGDIKLCFLAYCAAVSDVPSFGEGNSPGPNPLTPPAACDLIRHAREEGHVVIVSYHGGQEFYRIPCPVHRRIVRDLSAAGAHMVVSHHAHVFQGIEALNGNLLCYGLGNFHMNTPIQMAHRGSRVGLFVIVEFDRLGPCSYSAHFVERDPTTSALLLVSGDKEHALRELLNQVSAPLGNSTLHLRERRRDCARMLMGMNEARGRRWTGLSTRTRYMLTLALTRFRNSRQATRLRREELYRSSTEAMVRAAIRGLPSALLDFRTTGKCYRTYDMPHNGNP